jgi:hypothetical protein
MVTIFGDGSPPSMPATGGRSAVKSAAYSSSAPGPEEASMEGLVVLAAGEWWKSEKSLLTFRRKSSTHMRVPKSYMLFLLFRRKAL